MRFFETFETSKPVSVHPARLPAAVSLAHIIVGRDVVSVLVEVHVPIVLPHVDFKLPRRTPSLPAIVGIPQPVITLAEIALDQRRFWTTPHIEPSEEQSTQVSHISDITAPSHRKGQRHHDQDP